MARAELGVVLDNGGGCIKAGLVPLRPGASPGVPLVAANALARVGPLASSGRVGTSRRPAGMLVAAEIDEAPDFTAMSFRRAHDRGYVARWDVERDVWSSVLSADKGVGLADPGAALLLLTEPMAAPVHMRRATDELVFEAFGFAEYAAVPPARLVAEAGRALAGAPPRRPGHATSLVLDSGFSFTHAVPVVDGRELPAPTRRLNLGGKALTNHLKETVSFRSWNMMEETVVVNSVKERMTYVAVDFMHELSEARDGKSSARRGEYVLPDLSRGDVDPRGHVRRAAEEVDGTEQILAMENERISVPELLFHPSDVGLAQAGVAGLVVQAVEASPAQHRADLYASIVLAGGNCRIPGFRERVTAELRPLVADIYSVAVFMAEDPVTSAYAGGVQALQDRSTRLFNSVTRAEYEEQGHRITLQRFAAQRP
jgi:actin-related protein 6